MVGTLTQFALAISLAVVSSRIYIIVKYCLYVLFECASETISVSQNVTAIYVQK